MCGPTHSSKIRDQVGLRVGPNEVYVRPDVEAAFGAAIRRASAQPCYKITGQNATAICKEH